MEIALEVKNLSVKFDGNEVLKDISFSLPEGTITALIGPNGAGKTVLLKTILGLHNYQGEIKIFGENHLQKLDLIGYVPQYYAIDPSLPLTVFEFLKLTKNDEERINQVLKETDIENLKNKIISRLSGGQFERVLFARAILHQPKILFLDEPTLGLDPQTRNHIWSYIKELNDKEQMTIFFTTHYIDEAEKMAQNVAIIDYGKIIAQGSPQELKEKTSSQSLEEAFLKLTGHSIREEKAGAIDHLRLRRRMWRR